MSMPRSFGNTRSRSMKSAASHGLRKYQKHEIGAIAAAFGNGDMFTVIDPNGAETLVALGEKPLLFRGSIAVAGRKRPLHLSGGPGCLPNCGHRNASTLCLGLGTKELRSRERASNYWRCSQEA